MDKKAKAKELLKESEEILYNHVDIFSPFEAMKLAMTLRFLLAYIEDEKEE